MHKDIGYAGLNDNDNNTVHTKKYQPPEDAKREAMVKTMPTTATACSTVHVCVVCAWYSVSVVRVCVICVHGMCAWYGVHGMVCVVWCVECVHGVVCVRGVYTWYGMCV